MSEPPLALTKAQLALRVLQDRIRSGELKPGDRLSAEALTQELGMSPTPIREALRILQADRLVEYRVHRGIVVARLSAKEADEIYTLRAVLEPMATELGVRAMDDEALQRLERLHDEFHAGARAGDGSAVADCNGAWHWAIYEAADFRTLEDFIRRLWEAFPWRTMWTMPMRNEQSAAEHDAIMAAIRGRRPKEAARLVRRHIESGKDTLLEAIARQSG